METNTVNVGFSEKEMMQMMLDAAAFRAAQGYARAQMIEGGYLDARAVCAVLHLDYSQLKQENSRRQNSDE